MLDGLLVFVFGMLQTLTTLSDLKSSDLEHLIDLPSLESLDIGDCVGWTEESDYRVLGRLSHLHHLRLEQGPPEHCVLNHLTSLNLPSYFSHLELINFNMNMPMEQFNLPKARHGSDRNVRFSDLFRSEGHFPSVQIFRSDCMPLSDLTEIPKAKVS
jgi:hypothetical protein